MPDSARLIVKGSAPALTHVASGGEARPARNLQFLAQLCGWIVAGEWRILACVLRVGGPGEWRVIAVVLRGVGRVLIGVL